MNIAIIEKNNLYRESLRTVLNQIEDFTVVYESDNLQNVIHFFEILKIEIILIDYNIGEKKLNQINEQIEKFFPHVKAIIVSNYDEMYCNEKLLKEKTNVIFKNAEKKEFEKIMRQPKNN
jgi:DNA-binding NarL/FixJ family response regulator